MSFPITPRENCNPGPHGPERWRLIGGRSFVAMHAHHVTPGPFMAKALQGAYLWNEDDDAVELTDFHDPRPFVLIADY